MVDRPAVAAWVRDLGLTLRDGADVVEVGRRLAMPSGEVCVQWLIHDDGVLLLLWQGPPVAGAGRHPAFGGLADPDQGGGAHTVRTGLAPDGRGFAQLLHPGTPRGRVSFDERIRDGIPARRERHQAELDIPLPAWGGGRSLPPVRLAAGTIALAGCGFGGLGGRVDVRVGPGHDADRGITLGSMPLELWAPGAGVVEIPLVPAAAPPDGAGPAYLGTTREAASAGVPLALDRHGRASVGRGDGWLWDPPRRVQTLQCTFPDPLPDGPHTLIFPGLTAWRRIAPIRFAFGAAEQGGMFGITLGGGEAVLDVAVGQAFEEDRPTGPRRSGMPRSVTVLPWRHRIRSGTGGPAEVALTLHAQGGAADPWMAWFGAAGPVGVNGWVRQRAVGPAGAVPRVEVAAVALGAPLAPLVLPVPAAAPPVPPADGRSWGARLLAGRGLVATPEAARILDVAAARVSAGASLQALDILAAMADRQSQAPGGWLGALGLDPGTLLALVLRAAPPGGQAAGADVQLTPEADRALALAAEEARGEGGRPLDQGDLVIGILREGRGIAAGILEDAGLGLEPGRRAMRSFRHGPPADPAAGRGKPTADVP